jgi:hypothetical protein
MCYLLSSGRLAYISTNSYFMAVFTLMSGGTTILSKTTVSVFIDKMGSFVLVTAPQYKFIFLK